MNISSKSQYALRALIRLAVSQEIISIQEISQKEKIPAEYLEKIMAVLKRNQLVRGVKGSLGGYILSKKPTEISLADIVLPLEKKKIPLCLKAQPGLKQCRLTPECAAKILWTKLYRQWLQALQSITLADAI